MVVQDLERGHGQGHGKEIGVDLEAENIFDETEKGIEVVPGEINHHQ